MLFINRVMFSMVVSSEQSHTRSNAVLLIFSILPPTFPKSFRNPKWKETVTWHGQSTKPWNFFSHNRSIGNPAQVDWWALFEYTTTSKLLSIISTNPLNSHSLVEQHLCSEHSGWGYRKSMFYPHFTRMTELTVRKIRITKQSCAHVKAWLWKHPIDISNILK